MLCQLFRKTAVQYNALLSTQIQNGRVQIYLSRPWPFTKCQLEVHLSKLCLFKCKGLIYKKAAVASWFLLTSWFFLPLLLLRFAQTQTLPYANSRKGGRVEAASNGLSKGAVKILLKALYFYFIKRGWQKLTHRWWRKIESTLPFPFSFFILSPLSRSSIRDESGGVIFSRNFSIVFTFLPYFPIFLL